jgi:hypothetical protein
MVDAGVMWTALGTLVSAVGVAVGWRQRKVGGTGETSGQGAPRPDVQGLSVLPPTGRLPSKVRGRDDLLRDLVKLVRHPPGGFVVLSGMGGVGKSTVATALAAQVRHGQVGRRRCDVWWVSVADRSSLASAMVTVAQHLGASDADLEVIATGQAAAPDRVWARLDRARRRWLLILDNADEPEVLARPVATSTAAATVDAGDGWLRPTRKGLVVVTSRDASARTWGRHARVIGVEPLDENDAARVLMDWAPAAGSEADARRLADRLGRLPLALGLAGSYLESDVALKRSFAEYQHSLDGATDLLAAEPSAAGPRAAVMETWELSLDALAQRHVPQARSLLRLLSCYAPSTPIPLDLLDPERLLPLLAACGGTTPATTERDLQIGLRQLRQLRMIDASALTAHGERALAVHPVVADANRAHLATGPGAARDHDPGLVRRTAVDLLTAAIDRLDADTPVHWPRYRLLAPHVHAVFATVAPHLDPGAEHLRALVRSTTRTADAHDRSGAVQAGLRLCRATFGALAVLGEDDPASLYLRHILAWETAIQGRSAEAQAIHEDVATRRERVLGRDHPDTLWSHHELGWVAGLQGQWAVAESIYRDVLGRRERVLGRDHPDTLMTRHELAWAIASQGRGEEAEQALQVIVDARARVLGRDHPRTLASRHELAWAMATQGRWRAAERTYRAVLTARRRVLGEEHPDALTTRHELAWTLAMQGRQRDAATEYAETLATRERVLGPDHPDTVVTRLALEALRDGTVASAHHVV